MPAFAKGLFLPGNPVLVKTFLTLRLAGDKPFHPHNLLDNFTRPVGGCLAAP